MKYTLHVCDVSEEFKKAYPLVIYDEFNNYAALDITSPKYDTLEKCLAVVQNPPNGREQRAKFKGKLLATFTDYDDLITNYPELLI